MSKKDPGAPGFKERAKEELKDYFHISLYLALLFCALVLYTKMVLKQNGVSTENDALNYSFAIVNALVIGKVILIGEMMHLGKRAETRPLYQTILHKTFVFALLTFAFHLVEEWVKRVIHHEPRFTVWDNMHLETMIARAIVILCTFLPLFAYRELRRVLGEEKLREIFLAPRHTDNPSLSASS